ncbi:sporulation protein YjcZ [Paenibacillus oralis]|uniref:Sporulation protein YjcZ n=1 Tax=Paenibacillus oralis TaxID=2490856 RepID=A0A3P3TYA6_9BACL|nr:sporulation protein YjcZ [Paenibacillus oralis]RRJ62696.1 sporulation protein YjcZ [Paenibacillus oralis]
MGFPNAAFGGVGAGHGFFTSTGVILVLFILLVIVLRTWI